MRVAALNERTAYRALAPVLASSFIRMKLAFLSARTEWSCFCHLAKSKAFSLSGEGGATSVAILAQVCGLVPSKR